MDIEKNLSAEAKKALINFGGSRQGTRAPRGVTALVLFELHTAGLITSRDNLTNRGGLVRDCVLNDALDAL